MLKTFSARGAFAGCVLAFAMADSVGASDRYPGADVRADP